MAAFFYKATTLDGKVLEGSMDASDERSVLAKLQDLGYLPIYVGTGEAKKSLLTMKLEWPWGRKGVSNKDLMLFTRELHTMLHSGLPLDRSLAILAEVSESQQFRDIIQKVLDDIKGGKSLGEAMGEHPRVFPKLYMNMVRAGEAGGALNQVLQRLVEFLESSEALRSYFSSALIYPALLGTVGVLSVTCLIVFVVPEFSRVFLDMGVPVPLPMRIMLGASAVISQGWWAILLAGIGIHQLFKRWIATEEGRTKWDARILHLPLVGKLLQKVEVARFARTLGTLLHSAVPLLQSMSIVKEVIGNRVIAQAMDPIKQGIKKGEGITGPIQESGVFPPLAIHLLRVGEESGKLDSMLLQIADTYDREIKENVQRLVALFEPLMILIMGLVIGTIVVSMMASIFSINDVPF
jgi:general secretion pathway protein F